MYFINGNPPYHRSAGQCALIVSPGKMFVPDVNTGMEKSNLFSGQRIITEISPECPLL
jgi:hypothetical protein